MHSFTIMPVSFCCGVYAHQTLDASRVHPEIPVLTSVVPMQVTTVMGSTNSWAC